MTRGVNDVRRLSGTKVCTRDEVDVIACYTSVIYDPETLRCVFNQSESPGTLFLLHSVITSFQRRCDANGVRMLPEFETNIRDEIDAIVCCISVGQGVRPEMLSCVFHVSDSRSSCYIA